MPNATIRIKLSSHLAVIHAFIFIALTAVTTRFPALCIWPLIWLVPLTAFAALVTGVPPLRKSFHSLRFGHCSKAAVIATIAIAVGSGVVLVTFETLTHPDVSAFRSFVPVSILGNAIWGCLTFSVLNALLEEVVFRGILFDAVQSEWGNRVAVVATAFLFGYGHMHGYPPGPLGALLAGVLGLLLGWLRVFSGGIGLAVIAHIAADATIFTLITQPGSL